MNRYRFPVGAAVVAAIGLGPGAAVAFGPAPMQPSAPKWKFTTGTYVESRPAVSPDNRTVFVGSDDSNLYAVDASTGARRV